MNKTIYDLNGIGQSKYDNYYGDGVFDDTTAIQNIIDISTNVCIPEAVDIRLTRSLVIDIAKLQSFDGGKSTFIVDGDFPAFVINGSMISGTADPSSLTEQIIKKESGFIIKNCKIIGKSASEGTGIEVSGCVNITIDKCYVANLKEGVVIKNRNRDIILSNNHIYAIYNAGIKLESTVNLHQMNIVGNTIQYCHKCIHIDDVEQYANYQITGNDIEIAPYPAHDLDDSRCVLVDIANNKSGYFAELVMCGNTIQGHSRSNFLIEINGGGVAKYTSINGNHISNCKQACIKLASCSDTSVSGNTFKNDTYDEEGTYVLKAIGCNNTVFASNTFSDIGGLVNADGSTNPNNGLIVNGNVGTCGFTPVVTAGTNNGLLITDNVVNSAVLQ